MLISWMEYRRDLHGGWRVRLSGIVHDLPGYDAWMATAEHGSVSGSEPAWNGSVVARVG